MAVTTKYVEVFVRIFQMLLIVPGLFLVAGQILGAPDAPGTADTLPTVELPAELDRVLRDYERAWRANDLTALLALFTKDGFVLQHGRPPARGKAALDAAYRGQTGGPLRLRALSYAQADTVAYIIGAYSYGDSPGDQGKFTLTLRREPGERWLIASDMDNGNEPRHSAPAPQAAGPAPSSGSAAGDADGPARTRAAGEPTRVTILVDAFGKRTDLRKDWGYAALVEHEGLRILFDTGNDSETFRHNVETLGIDLARLDFIVVSHRHNDHTDGLRYLLSVNPQVPIYAPRDEYFGGTTPPVFFQDPATSLPPHMRYFDGQVPGTVPHGSPWKHAQIRSVEGELEVAPGIRLVSNISGGPAFSETPEVSLSIDTPDGQILLVGCSHPGIEQILESIDAKTRDVRLLVGGLHWVTMPEEKVEGLARALHDEYKVQAVAPGHCTSERGFAALSRLYGRRYVYAGLGTAIEL